MFAHQLRRAAICGNMHVSRKALLWPPIVLATSNLAEGFITPSFGSCRSVVKKTQPFQPTRLPSLLMGGDDNNLTGVVADDDSDNNLKGATDDANAGDGQDAGATVGESNPDKPLWPIHFTKEEIDAVNEMFEKSHSTDFWGANRRRILQWISTSCDLIEDGDGRISYVMAVEAFNRFPMKEDTMVVQKPRLKKPRTITNKPLLDGRDFLFSLLKAMYAANRWNGYDLMVEMESYNLVSTNLKRHQTPQDAINYFEDKMTGQPVWIRSTSPELNTVKFEKDDFTQTVIDDTYVNRKQTRTVKRFLQGTHRTVQQGRDIQGFDFPPIGTDYVKHKSNVAVDLSSTLEGIAPDFDKRRCIVVTGESGSGKTTFAVNSLIEEGYDVFYAAIQRDDYDNEYGPPEEVSQTCCDAVDKVIVAVDSLADESRKRSCSSLLSFAKSCKSREAWAGQVADRALSRVLRESRESQFDLQTWWNGMLDRQDRPRRLAVVLDEVRSLDLCEGLVEICRDLIVGFEKNLAQPNAFLMRCGASFVLCGPGLDDLPPHRPMGTDPSKYSVLVVGEPDFDALQKGKIITPHEKAAIDRGVYGRVLSKNSRMLFQGVLPILRGDFLRNIDPNEDNLDEVLIGVASNWSDMRNAVRVDNKSNAFGKLTPRERNDLLKDAYLYHLLLGLFDVATHSSPLLNYSNEILWLSKHRQVDRLLSLLLKRRKINKRHPAFADEVLLATSTADEKFNTQSNPPRDIFAEGLVASETSVALKYLACRGNVDPLVESDGAGFETMVGASLARMMEALGYQVHRVTLEQAWPHKATNNINYTQNDIANLTVQLGQYGKNTTRQASHSAGESDSDGNEEVDATRWTSFLRSEELHCIIFRQGVSDAQGPDLFMLYQCRDSGEMLLDSIRAKHRTVPASSELAEWFQSVGVTETSTSPETGRAGWSYAGLEGFRNYVQDQTGKSVKLGRRIIASSVPAADWQANSCALQWADEQQLDFAAVRIWPKEMFEPMISVLDNTNV